MPVKRARVKRKLCAVSFRFRIPIDLCPLYILLRRFYFSQKTIQAQKGTMLLVWNVFLTQTITCFLFVQMINKQSNKNNAQN